MTALIVGVGALTTFLFMSGAVPFWFLLLTTIPITPIVALRLWGLTQELIQDGVDARGPSMVRREDPVLTIETAEEAAKVQVLLDKLAAGEKVDFVGGVQAIADQKAGAVQARAVAPGAGARLPKVSRGPELPKVRRGG